MRFTHAHRVGIEMSKVEVRFENLHVDADVFVGGRAMPTVLNSVRNFFEVLHWIFSLLLLLWVCSHGLCWTLLQAVPQQRGMQRNFPLAQA